MKKSWNLYAVLYRNDSELEPRLGKTIYTSGPMPVLQLDNNATVGFLLDEIGFQTLVY
jgi:hypothetical protein